MIINIPYIEYEKTFLQISIICVIRKYLQNEQDEGYNEKILNNMQKNNNNR